ncbi:hypothetical protein BDR03DRAFT_961829 [Suillus americanus]|nr:hypothetical protein BDR03DRAFT_961829 [Suillus americanus]
MSCCFISTQFVKKTPLPGSINMNSNCGLVSYQAGTDIGLVSGAKIVDILKKNQKYEEYVAPHFPNS